ncbi:hypothetical protein HY839_03800 [Candidatus Azambacteria bacterium]|nr:hypothetical protein [Candidatus Azambacteria bacterium]
MYTVTFLGPCGATFSHNAYRILAKIFDAPPITDQRRVRYIPASSNGDVLALIAHHGGYGTIAMETLAEGRVAEPLESFIDLLKAYAKTDDCPFRIVGAIRLRLHFCLMVRPGVSPGNITTIIAHPKALGACAKRIALLGATTANAESNGEATRRIAENNDYAGCAALGPRSAAKKYGLSIVHGAFEDREAITTFFLIAPSTHPISPGKQNRMLITYKVPHTPGALVRSLQPFEREGLNLIQIHSVHTGNHTYNFAIEIEVKEQEQAAAQRAMKKFISCVDKYLSFGPFPVLSR